MNLFSIMDGCCCTVMLSQSSCWGGYGWHDFLLCLFSMLYLLFKQYISIKYYIRHLSKTKPERPAFKAGCDRSDKLQKGVSVMSEYLYETISSYQVMRYQLHWKLCHFSPRFLHSWDWGYCQQSWQEADSEISISASFQLYKLSQSERISRSRSLWSLQTKNFSFESFYFPIGLCLEERWRGDVAMLSPRWNRNGI